MKYDNYIFDFYGTLVDIKTNERKASLWQKTAAILTDMGVPYDATTLKKDYKQFANEELEAIKAYHAKPEIELRKVFRKLMSPWCSDEMIDQFAITFRVLSREYITLYKDVPAIFDEIHKNGGKVFLLSNAQSCFTVPEIKSMGIYDMFDDIFISSDMECAKPDPNFINMLIRKHKLDIGKSIMIGNDYTSDITIANAVGMDSLYIHTATSPAIIPVKSISATYADIKNGEPAFSFFKNNIL
ncbi:MAG: HAD family hydrolase [Lachnospiraceae bacterium]|nr:HAD family hydrolase [Candidatus Colinaster scatohippi]